MKAEKGSLTIAPHSASTLRLRFEPACSWPPTEVGALRFRWGVVRGDGERYVQFTEFRQQQERLAMAGDFYYDPIAGALRSVLLRRAVRLPHELLRARPPRVHRPPHASHAASALIGRGAAPRRTAVSPIAPSAWWIRAPSPFRAMALWAFVDTA